MISQKLVFDCSNPKLMQDFNVFPNFGVDKKGIINYDSYKPKKEVVWINKKGIKQKRYIESNKRMLKQWQDNKQKMQKFLMGKVCQVIVFKINHIHSKYKLDIQYATGFFCKFTIPNKSIYKLITVFHLIANKNTQQQLFLYIHTQSKNIAQLLHKGLPNKVKRFELLEWIKNKVKMYQLKEVKISKEMLEHRKRYLWQLQEQELLEPKLDLQPLPSLDYLQLQYDQIQYQNCFTLDLFQQVQLTQGLSVYTVGYSQSQGQINFNDDDYALTMQSLGLYNRRRMNMNMFLNEGKSISTGEIYASDERFIDVKCTTNFGSSGSPLCIEKQLIGFNVGYFSDLQQPPIVNVSSNVFLIDRFSKLQTNVQYSSYKPFNIFVNLRHPYIIGRILQQFHNKYFKNPYKNK